MRLFQLRQTRATSPFSTLDLQIVTLSNTTILSYSLRFLTISSRQRSVNASTSMICRNSQPGFSWISIRRRTFGRSSHHNDGHGLAVHTVRSLHIDPALRVLHGDSLPKQQTQLRCQIMLNRLFSSLLCTSSLAPESSNPSLWSFAIATELRSTPIGPEIFPWLDFPSGTYIFEIRRSDRPASRYIEV
jgi:hypothetical protein